MKTKLLKKTRQGLKIITVDNKKYYLQQEISSSFYPIIHWNTIFSGELSKCNNKMHSHMKERLIDLGYFKLIT